MNKSPIDIEIIIKTVIFSFIIILIIFFSQFSDRRTRIVFCDVGQGDAAYIRVKNKMDILIDAGPNNKVLNCLGKHMPFYDRKIELAIITHHEKDHFGGFNFIIDRYHIDKILMGKLNTNDQLFNQMIKKINEKKIKIEFPTAGKEINLLQDKLIFYWPTDEFIVNNVIFPHFYYSKHDRRINTNELHQYLGMSKLNNNSFSLIFEFKENNFSVLFTGDTSNSILTKVLAQNKLTATVLKIPHHGSKNGLSYFLVKSLYPKIAVISCGKNNSYGHPHQKVLEILNSLKIKIRRTDTESDIIFKIPNSNF